MNVRYIIHIVYISELFLGMEVNSSFCPWPEVNHISLPENTTAHGYTHQASARISLLGGKGVISCNISHYFGPSECVRYHET